MWFDEVHVALRSPSPVFNQSEFAGRLLVWENSWLKKNATRFPTEPRTNGSALASILYKKYCANYCRPGSWPGATFASGAQSTVEIENVVI